MKGATLALLTALLLSSSASAATFADVTWTGATSTDWYVGSNWSTGAVPGPGDHAIVASTGVTATIAGASASVDRLTIKSGGSVALSGADLVVASRVDLDGSMSSVSAGDQLICSGDLDVSSTGNYTAGAGLIDLDSAGTMTVHASATPSPRIRIASGSRTAGSSTLDELLLTGGALTINDNTTLTVTGVANLQGGTLNFATVGGNSDTFNVDGDLVQTGTVIGTTTTLSRIYVAGDWLADSSFTMTNGWVYLDGADSSIGGAAPEFHRVQMTAGVNTLLSDVSITGTLKTTGGSTAGSGWIVGNGTITPIQSSSQTLNRLRVASGANQIASTRVNELEIMGGNLILQDNATLTVYQDAHLIGGTLDFLTVGGNSDTLDIAGDLIQTGTVMGTTTALSRVYVEGNWMADGPFSMANGWVYLDGADSNIGGLAPEFHRLQMSAGINTLLTDVGITGTLKTTSGTTAGAGWLLGKGTVTPISSSSKVLNRFRVHSGVNEFYSTRIDDFEVVGGSLTILDNVTLTVNNDARLIGGTLDFSTVGGNYDNLDVAGDLIQTGTSMGTTTALSRIYVAGDWSAATPFAMPNGWVYMDGANASIKGLAPQFGRISFVAPMTTILSATEILGTVFTNSGATDGPEWLYVTATTDAISTGAHQIGKLRIASGSAIFQTSRIGELEVTGGNLHINDNVTLTVDGDCRMTGGSISFDNVGGNFDTLDVNGDFFQSGAVLSATSPLLRIYCAGDWRSDTQFVIKKGWVYLDGLADTLITGVDPTFFNLRVTNAKRTASDDFHVRGNLEVQTNATIELLADMEMGGDLNTTWSGASIIGSKSIIMTAAGFTKTNTTPLPHCILVSGIREMRTCYINSVQVGGGEFLIAENATVNILGDASFGAGVLSFAPVGGNYDTLNIDGNLSQSVATIGTTTPLSRIYVAGDWLAANPFELAEGWVYLDGAGGVIAGPMPTFKRLSLQSGVRTINSDVLISGTVVSTGGSTDGAAFLECVANVQPISSGANLFKNLRVSASSIPLSTTRVDVLEITGGELVINDNTTLTVQDEARLLGGTLSFNPSGGNYDTLLVQGDLTQTGSVMGTTTHLSRIYIAGDWSAATPFAMPAGWVYFNGTSSSIGGLAPKFGRLSFQTGTTSVLSKTEVVGTVHSSGGITDGPEWLEVTANTDPISTGSNLITKLRIHASTIPFATSRIDNLQVTGGELLIQENVDLTVESLCELIGGTLSFAPSGGNFDDFIVNGDLVHTGTVSGTTTSLSRFYVRGNWSSTDAYSMASGWVHFDGVLPATIGGTSPTFGNVQTTGQTRLLISDTDVLGSMTNTTNGVIDVAAMSLDIQGDLTSTQGGAQIIGTGPVLFSGNGTLSTNSLGTPPIEVIGGVRGCATATVEALIVTAGELSILEHGTLHVTGDADLHGGTLSFITSGGNLDTLEIDGNLTQTGTTLGSTSNLSRIYVSGDWSADTPFTMANGWVYLDAGDAQIAGLAPEFKRLQLSSGVYTVNSETEIIGTIVSIGGTTTGPEWLNFTDNVQVVQTGASNLGRVRVSAGVIPFTTSSIGELEIVGGEFKLIDHATITVTGNANLLAGTLSFAASGGNYDTLVVQGNVYQIATVSGESSTLARFWVEGDWHSNSTFAMASGTVELNGTGATLLGGTVPGNNPAFPHLSIRNGVRQVATDTTLSAATATVISGARLQVTANSLMPVGTPIQVKSGGVLDIQAGARLAPDPTSSIVIDSGGRLELIGTGGAPAVLEGLGGGLDCIVNGTIAAREFEVLGTSAAGLTLSGSASLGAAPDDLRSGLFSFPDSAVGSALLTLEGTSGATLANLRFEDPLGVGTYNVSRSSAAPVTFANAFGGFAGATFENDPTASVSWGTLPTSDISGFSAKGGPGQVYLTWTSTNEAAGISTWRLESSAISGGPFSLVTELTASGPSTYNYTNTGLAADQTVYYRLVEKHGSGFVEWAGEDSATPWSSAQPANLATVGPGGDYATIQEAIDAATHPVSVISIAAGSYPSFQVIGMTPVQLHILADGSGPIVVDASVTPVEIAFTTFGQVVELAGLDITGGATNGAVLIHDNVGSVLLDTLTVTGGAGQTGLYAASCLAVNVSRCNITGTPGIDVGPVTEVYIGRGSVDTLDVAAGGAVQTAGVTPGALNASPGSDVVQHTGVMPNVQCGSFQSLGVPFTLDFAAEPASFYQIATSAGLFPLDLGDTDFWQMLLLTHFANYIVVNQGFTHGVTGLVQLNLELPADGAFLGAALPLQGWAISVVPILSVRFSNMRTVVAMP